MRKIIAYGESLIRWDSDPQNKIMQFPTGTAINFLANISEFKNDQPELLTAFSSRRDSLIFKDFLKTKDIKFDKSYFAKELNMGSYIIYRKPAIFSWDVVYNRTNTSWTEYSQEAKSFDLADCKKSDHIHLDGISLQTHEKGFDKIMDIIKNARAKDMTISFDFNFRWTLGGDDSLELFKLVMKEVDFLNISTYDINHLMNKELNSIPNIKEFLLDYPNIKYVYGYKKRTVSEHLAATPFLWDGKKMIEEKEIEYKPIDLIGQGDAFSAHMINQILNEESIDVLAALEWSIYKTKYIGDSTVPTVKEYENYKKGINVLR